MVKESALLQHLELNVKDEVSPRVSTAQTTSSFRNGPGTSRVELQVPKPTDDDVPSRRVICKPPFRKTSTRLLFV